MTKFSNVIKKPNDAIMGKAAIKSINHQGPLKYLDRYMNNLKIKSIKNIESKANERIWYSDVNPNFENILIKFNRYNVMAISAKTISNISIFLECVL